MKMRDRTKLKLVAREWTPWQSIPVTEEMREQHKHLRYAEQILTNSRFEVQTFPCATPIGGVVQATVIRHGDIAPISWDELQRIVHEIFGADVTAVEIFPPLEHEWHTSVGLRSLWILPSTWQIPFGLHAEGSWGRPVQ